jgi:hypothetical protein
MVWMDELEEVGRLKAEHEAAQVASKRSSQLVEKEKQAPKVPTLPLRADVLLSNSLFQELEDGITADFLKNYLGSDNLEEVDFLDIQVDAVCGSQRVESLGELLPNLQRMKLNLSSVCSIRDLGTNLQNLKVMWLCRCSLQDLWGIGACLPHLEELYVAFNDIRDLTPLSTHEALQVVDLEGNHVEDFSEVQSLDGVATLRELNLSLNPVYKDGIISRQHILEALPQLEVLDDIPRDGGILGDTDNTLLEDCEDDEDELEEVEAATAGTFSELAGASFSANLHPVAEDNAQSFMVQALRRRAAQGSAEKDTGKREAWAGPGQQNAESGITNVDGSAGSTAHQAPPVVARSLAFASATRAPPGDEEFACDDAPPSPSPAERTPSRAGRGRAEQLSDDFGSPSGGSAVAELHSRLAEQQLSGTPVCAGKPGDVDSNGHPILDGEDAASKTGTEPSEQDLIIEGLKRAQKPMSTLGMYTARTSGSGSAKGFLPDRRPPSSWNGPNCRPPSSWGHQSNVSTLYRPSTSGGFSELNSSRTTSFSMAGGFDTEAPSSDLTTGDDGGSLAGNPLAVARRRRRLEHASGTEQFSIRDLMRRSEPVAHSPPPASSNGDLEETLTSAADLLRPGTPDVRIGPARLLAAGPSTAAKALSQGFYQARPDTSSRPPRPGSRGGTSANVSSYTAEGSGQYSSSHYGGGYMRTESGADVLLIS